MAGTNIHDASAQMAGYFYQALVSLQQLIAFEDSSAQICIEKFDDIMFVQNEEPIELIQVKHQVQQQGSLSNTSVDLWKTIGTWINLIPKLGMDIEQTKFLILTTANVPQESAAFYLRNDKLRNPSIALTILQNAAEQSANNALKGHHSSFLALDPLAASSLIQRTYIHDGAPTIVHVEDEIRRFIRYATIERFEERVYQRLIGWWMQETIKCLVSDRPIFISQRHLREKLRDIAGEYGEDALPIDIVDQYKNFSQDELDSQGVRENTFLKQLALIASSDSVLCRAFRDYRNARTQRASWVREELLYIDELEGYEARLKDEWARLFEYMEENLKLEEDDDFKKQEAGKDLYRRIQEFDHPIRAKVNAPFVMRGTYHGLADKLEIGWHVDFLHELEKLLEEKS